MCKAFEDCSMECLHELCWFMIFDISYFTLPMLSYSLFAQVLTINLIGKFALHTQCRRGVSWSGCLFPDDMTTGHKIWIYILLWLASCKVWNDTCLSLLPFRNNGRVYRKYCFCCHRDGALRQQILNIFYKITPVVWISLFSVSEVAEVLCLRLRPAYSPT